MDPSNKTSRKLVSCDSCRVMLLLDNCQGEQCLLFADKFFLVSRKLGADGFLS